MKALIFNLELLEPVLATQPESGEENSSTTFGFVPGSMIRGALIRRYLNGKSPATLAQDEQARRLFLDGSVCFLNAYPYHAASKQRMLPRPFSWLVAKEDANNKQAKIFDFAIHEDEGLGNSKNPSGDFCIRDQDTVELDSTATQINVHNASDDPNLKAAGNSTVYRYQAIAAGEVLSAAILSEHADLLKLLQPLLEGEIGLGGSHTAGYGRVKIVVDETAPEEWHEYERGGDLTDRVVMTLLSDAILRNQSGQVAADLDQALQAVATISPLAHKAAFRRLRLVGGFNRQAGLPLPQEWALQAGSVLVYPANAFDNAKLNALVERGIGERRAEGFGRIAVNWFTQPQLQRHALTEPRTFAKPVKLSSESEKLAKQMAQRQLRTLLENQLVWAVNRAEVNRPPQNAQLSRVRSAVQQVLLSTDSGQPKNLDQLTQLLGSLKGAREQFERARVNQEPMLDWLKKRVVDLDVQAQFSIGENLPTVAGKTAEITPDLAVEYTARLIDGVMKKATKQSQPKEARR